MSLRAVIASAKSWLGTVESPPRSNVVPGITDWLAGADDRLGSSYAWCAAAVSRWMYDGGERDLCKMETGADAQFSNGFASVEMLAKAFQDKGQIYHTPKVGDLVIYDGYSHVGLVVGVNSDGSFKTIEGNTSNGVYERTRDLGDGVLEFARPHYDERASTSPSNPHPASGHSVGAEVRGYPGRLLERGDHGAAVRELQAQLNKLGAHLQVDGVYGSQTEAAVRDFQEGSGGLGVDGIVGPKTWAALWQGVSQSASVSPESAQAANAPESRPVTDPVTHLIDAVFKPVPPGVAAPNEGAAPSYPGAVLERGDHGATVREVQAQLNKLGAHLKVDGVYGSQTEAAVQHFQQGSDGLGADGIVGPKTWAALWQGASQSASVSAQGAQAPGYPGRLLERGDQGTDVREVQAQLNKLGAHLKVDGVYGSQTEAAVQHFQQGSDGLGADGIVGPKTWAALWKSHAQETDPPVPHPESRSLSPNHGHPSPFVLFELADAAYHASGAPQGWTRLDDQQITAMHLHPADLTPANSHFRAYLFRSEDGQTVLSFQGSEEPDLTSSNSREDWLNDLQQEFGLGSEYYSRAIRLAEQVSQVTNGDFEITGHSLGGGMAAAAGIIVDAKTTTFNAAGVSPTTLAPYHDSLGEATKHMADGRPLVDSYIVSGEILDMVQRTSDLSGDLLLSPTVNGILRATGHHPEPAAGVTHYLDDPHPLSFLERVTAPLKGLLSAFGDPLPPLGVVYASAELELGHAASLHGTDAVREALIGSHIS